MLFSFYVYYHHKIFTTINYRLCQVHSQSFQPLLRLDDLTFSLSFLVCYSVSLERILLSSFQAFLRMSIIIVFKVSFLLKVPSLPYISFSVLLTCFPLCLYVPSLHVSPNIILSSFSSPKHKHSFIIPISFLALVWPLISHLSIIAHSYCLSKHMPFSILWLLVTSLPQSGYPPPLFPWCIIYQPLSCISGSPLRQLPNSCLFNIILSQQVKSL